MNHYTKNNLRDGVELSYTDDGENVEVLVSPGWGAGWSTWNEFSVAVDKRIVDFFKKNGTSVSESEVEKFCESIGYNVYAGGWKMVEIETVPVGMKFVITEYDGFEELEIVGEDNYYVF